VSLETKRSFINAKYKREDLVHKSSRFSYTPQIRINRTAWIENANFHKTICEIVKGTFSKKLGWRTIGRQNHCKLSYLCQ